MSLIQQETLVRSFIDLVLNKRQLRLLPDFVSLDILDYSPFILAAAHEARDFAHDVHRLLAAFEDLRIEVEQIVNAPGRVALSFALSGCNTGPLPFAAQPTQRRAVWNAMAIFRFDEARISEIRGVSDRSSMLQQLGLT
jgi:predicted ester cyclase